MITGKRWSGYVTELCDSDVHTDRRLVFWSPVAIPLFCGKHFLKKKDVVQVPRRESTPISNVAIYTKAVIYCHKKMFRPFLWALLMLLDEWNILQALGFSRKVVLILIWQWQDPHRTQRTQKLNTPIISGYLYLHYFWKEPILLHLLDYSEATPQRFLGLEGFVNIINCNSLA